MAVRSFGLLQPVGSPFQILHCQLAFFIRFQSFSNRGTILSQQSEDSSLQMTLRIGGIRLYKTQTSRNSGILHLHRVQADLNGNFLIRSLLISCRSLDLPQQVGSRLNIFRFHAAVADQSCPHPIFREQLKLKTGQLLPGNFICLLDGHCSFGVVQQHADGIGVQSVHPSPCGKGSGKPIHCPFSHQFILLSRRHHMEIHPYFLGSDHPLCLKLHSYSLYCLP